MLMVLLTVFCLLGLSHLRLRHADIPHVPCIVTLGDPEVKLEQTALVYMTAIQAGSGQGLILTDRLCMLCVFLPWLVDCVAGFAVHLCDLIA